MNMSKGFQVGDRFVVGNQILEMTPEFHSSLQDGDEVLAIASTQSLKRIPRDVQLLVDSSVDAAMSAFHALAQCNVEQINRFFEKAAQLLESDENFDPIAEANAIDVDDAKKRGRSTTRLALSPKMRVDMVEAFRLWRATDMQPESKIDEVVHKGWTVEQWRSPLGVIGFVFEGRPNVFADATGVLKSGNSVVFRIGSDALRTAEAIMQYVVVPALVSAGLPVDAVKLISSREHAAGWRLFSNRKLSLAVARGSGAAVAELGSIAQQSGVPTSLHGTGGAWMLVGEHFDSSQLMQYVEHSLDRKVCNTVNAVCIPESQAHVAVPLVVQAATSAAAKRNTKPLFHCVNGAEEFIDDQGTITVVRPEGEQLESQTSISSESDLSHEFEWEENPEFFIVLTKSLSHSIQLFNTYSPQFVVSAISQSDEEQHRVWSECNAPFVGNGFTRWVDGQFALLRPELGLSNWQTGRLFARGGVLSGDSAYTVRLRVNQNDPQLHR